MEISRTIRRDFLTYASGYVLALVLTCGAFAIVYFHLLPRVPGFAVILGLAFLQIIVHMRCFLHINLGRSARSDLQLILFSAIIISLMVSGTLVVLFNLRVRMM